jgi:hypothetical protein
MRRHLLQATAIALVVATLSTPLRAQALLVFDPSTYYEAVVQVIQLIQQFELMVKEFQRLPVDMATRYRAFSPAWTLYDLAGGLRFAQPILQALNTGDPSGADYRRVVNPLDVPDDILARMPAALRSRLETAYGTIELADRIAERGVDQSGTVRANGQDVLNVIAAMQADAVSLSDTFQTQTALLNKINGASVLGLRLSEQTNQFLADAIEQLLVDNTRKRETEATVMNATITQWRYGQAYGADLFRNTAADLDGWRLR